MTEYLRYFNYTTREIDIHLLTLARFYNSLHHQHICMLP